MMFYPSDVADTIDTLSHIKEVSLSKEQLEKLFQYQVTCNMTTMLQPDDQNRWNIIQQHLEKIGYKLCMKCLPTDTYVYFYAHNCRWSSPDSLPTGFVHFNVPVLIKLANH